MQHIVPCDHLHVSFSFMEELVAANAMIDSLNLKRTNSRGIKQAMKHVLMSALVYSLKKYVNFIKRQRMSVSAAHEFHVHINKMNTVFIILPLRPGVTTGYLYKI